MTPLDRTNRPPSGEIRPFAFPAFQRRVLSCGLVLYLAPVRQIPLVEMDLLLPSGGQYDPLGQSGLAAMHADLLDEGTTSQSSQQIAERMESLGGAIGSSANWDTGSIHFQLLSKYLDSGLDTLAELVRASDFPEHEVTRIRRQRQMEILRRLDTPTYPALQRLREMTFGDHPYRHMLLGSRESLEDLGRNDCLDFHRRHVGPVGSYLIAVGDFDPDAITAAAEKHFGDWPEAEIGPLEPPIAPERVRGVRVTVIDRPGSEQTELRLGHLGILRTDEDLPAALVANEVFGGAFTSRINLNLRERHGLTYNASSRFGFRRGLGPWVISSAVGTESVGLAVREILQELRILREEAPPAEEVRGAQDYLVGVFPYTVQTIRDLSARLEVLAVHNLPDDYYAHYPAILGEVTPEEVLAAAQRRFHPEDLGIVAVGPVEEIRSQLEEFGEIEVVTTGPGSKAS